MGTMTTKRSKDTEEVVAGVKRQVRALENRAMDEDPWVMAEMGQIRDELDNAMVRVVARLRDTGYTWNDIGYEFGMTPTTACKRWDRKIRQLRRDEANAEAERIIRNAEAHRNTHPVAPGEARVPQP